MSKYKGTIFTSAEKTTVKPDKINSDEGIVAFDSSVKKLDSGLDDETKESIIWSDTKKLSVLNVKTDGNIQITDSVILQSLNKGNITQLEAERIQSSVNSARQKGAILSDTVIEGMVKSVEWYNKSTEGQKEFKVETIKVKFSDEINDLDFSSQAVIDSFITQAIKSGKSTTTINTSLGQYFYIQNLIDDKKIDLYTGQKAQKLVLSGDYGGVAKLVHTYKNTEALNIADELYVKGFLLNTPYKDYYKRSKNGENTDENGVLNDSESNASLSTLFNGVATNDYANTKGITGAMDKAVTVNTVSGKTFILNITDFNRAIEEINGVSSDLKNELNLNDNYDDNYGKAIATMLEEEGIKPYSKGLLGNTSTIAYMYHMDDLKNLSEKYQTIVTTVIDTDDTVANILATLYMIS